MRALVDFAVRRRVTVFMVALAVTAFGFVGYSRLPLELFPDIAYPSLTVQTDFPDTAPQEVEHLITRPIEEAVGVLGGLQTLHSTSRPGSSEVTLEFGWGSNMDLLSMEAREKLDRVVLPDDAEDPIVVRFDPSLDPILRLALAGGDDLGDMRYLAEMKIKQDFETIRGVAAAQIRGGLEEEIQIAIDQERLAALGIPLEQVRKAVDISNVNVPGGALRGKEHRYLIRTVNEFDDLEEIADLIIWQKESATVRLREVAEIYMGAKERQEITRAQGRESVEISLYKEGDANTVTVARRIREQLVAWQAKLPPGLTLTVLFDQSGFIEQAVNEVRNAALIGGLLAVLMLFLFLRDVPSTIIIATAIPLSVIATFMVMYRMDISLNIMSLGGLTLGVGMLVDNSIVVLESVYRKRQEGLDRRQAAVEGATEVGPAVVASTFTTVAVFLPIAFVEGIAGQLFKDQALTVTISLTTSLLVALTMIPMLSAIGGKGRRMHSLPAVPNDRPQMTLGVLSRIYDRLVRAAVRRRWVTLAAALGLFFASIGALRWLGTELIPQLNEGEFFFEVSLPEGTSLSATDRVLGRMEKAVAAEDGVERYYSTVGSRLVPGGMSMNTKAENLGQLNVVMEDRADAEREARVVNRLRGQFVDIPDLDMKFGRPSYFSLKTPIEVVVYGEDLERLRVFSIELAKHLRTVRGLVDVRSSLEAGNPELQVVFDRHRVASLGLDMGLLSETLKNRVQGVVPTRFKKRDRLIDIRIRNLEGERSSMEDIRNLVVSGPDGTQLRLLTVADVSVNRGPAEIHRLGQQRAAVITANLKGRTLGSAIEAVKEIIPKVPLPRGFTTELGGQNREMKVSFESLRFAIGLAIFLVYLVMASTFESFLDPLIVLFTIPLSLVGVVGGLLATGTAISVIVLIGSILLVGIVVNNAIVLIDTINRLRRAGVAKEEAVIRAGHMRLRPIVMTTLTTILGLLPMAMAWGEGAELRSPLAIAVASGLFVSTLLTLVVIPAAYMSVPSTGAQELAVTDGTRDGVTGRAQGDPR
jgi:HAE1 family hydrophobic/amphiphilic exporter-1